jgi:hypothetical protein
MLMCLHCGGKVGLQGRLDDDDDDNNNNNNDRKTGKLLTIHGQHHPKADVDRLHVPRKQGGRA